MAAAVDDEGVGFRHRTLISGEKRTFIRAR
jgi:hypothetical protein